LQEREGRFGSQGGKQVGPLAYRLKIEKDRVTTGIMDAVMYRSYAWYGIRPGDRQLKDMGNADKWIWEI